MKTKKCLICSSKFKPKNNRQKYCSKKCWKEGFEKMKYGYYPKMRCQACHQLFQLHYDPIKQRKKMKHTRCPNCGKNPFVLDNNWRIY